MTDIPGPEDYASKRTKFLALIQPMIDEASDRLKSDVYAGMILKPTIDINLFEAYFRHATLFLNLLAEDLINSQSDLSNVSLALKRIKDGEIPNPPIYPDQEPLRIEYFEEKIKLLPGLIL